MKEMISARNIVIQVPSAVYQKNAILYTNNTSLQQNIYCMYD